MGKGKMVTFTVFAALGAIAGYASYMISKNGFSEETKKNYSKVVDKAINVGTDIKRTYTSIGDKEEFTSNSKNLGDSAMKLASKAGNLVASASNDMYNYAKNQITKAIDNTTEDAEFDSLDNAYANAKTDVSKKKESKTNAKVAKKTTTKNATEKSTLKNSKPATKKTTKKA